MHIRIAREEDIPGILGIYAPYVLTTTYTFEYTVPTEVEFLQRFRQITAQFPWLVWEEEGAILGYAYGSLPFERAAYAWCAEASVYLAPDCRRKGIGTALYRALEQLLQKQGYQVVYAIITAENTGSLAFHQQLGYRRIAEFDRCGNKFGRWLGVVWMEKRLNFVENPLQMPTSFPALVENDRILPDILAILSLS